MANGRLSLSNRPQPWTRCLYRLAPFALLFLASQCLLRLLLLTFRVQLDQQDIGAVIQALLTGALYDAAVLPYVLLVPALYFLMVPLTRQGRRGDRIGKTLLYFSFAFALLCLSVAEWLFWNEFSSRFNFIAVDYLVYTHEVIGNLVESYPLPVLVAAAAALAGALTFFHDRHRRPVAFAPVRLAYRVAAVMVCIAWAGLAYVGMHRDFAENLANRPLGELARNGLYELFAAYRNNALPYERFYVTDHAPIALRTLRDELDQDGSTLIDRTITRHVSGSGPDQRPNIVIVTMESFSATFMKTFGSQDDLTPVLDGLAGQSLLFTNMHAIGTRTVYGLAGITLSIPPVPGNSIVRRPRNEGLFSLASVLNKEGYRSKFLYGGYGYFDNMNRFFGGNGYDVIDRGAFKKSDISFANIWGMADEDLFRRVISENDEAHRDGVPFFDMVLTTSNHRPYTYPAGKIDIPSGTGRPGAVKYTDYAIGAFLKEARTRPWFDNTIFVFVADHTAGSAGKIDLEPQNYHIPCLIYAPGMVPARRVDGLVSQIDLAPTLLGLLNIHYDSRFYGVDLLQASPQRALISNYQQLGFLTGDELIVLKPGKRMDAYRLGREGFVGVPMPSERTRNRALGYYQSARFWRIWNKDGVPTPEHIDLASGSTPRSDGRLD